VITTGIAIGTLFTLFVVPAMYLLLAHNHQSKQVGDSEPLTTQNIPAS